MAAAPLSHSRCPGIRGRDDDGTVCSAKVGRRVESALKVAPVGVRDDSGGHNDGIYSLVELSGSRAR